MIINFENIFIWRTSYYEMNRLIIADSETNANMFFATGVLVPDPFVFMQLSGKKIVLANILELERIRKESSGIEVLDQGDYVKKLRGKKTLATLAHHYLKEMGVKEIYVQATFPVSAADDLRKRGVRVKVQDPLFDRSRKSVGDIRAIAKTQRVAEAALGRAVDIIRKSKVKNGFLFWKGGKLTSELLRYEMERVCLENGVENPEGIIVSSGKDSTMPHKSGSGAIRAGVSIVIDIYPRSLKNRFFSDMTRTVCKGRPSEKLQELYDLVLKAQKAGLSRVRVGVAGGEIHEAVVEVFKKAGMEKYFIHSTGHGVGLDLHEAPGVGAGGKDKLKPGMVITVEPGLYVPNLGGVRIEDIIVVTGKGYRNLSKAPKTFTV